MAGSDTGHNAQTSLPGEVAIEPVALEALDSCRFKAVLAIRDWLTECGPHLVMNDLLSGLAERLNRAGVPVDRISAASESLHSEYAGMRWTWTRGSTAEPSILPHGEMRTAIYNSSPFAYASRTGRWFLLDLRQTPSDLFPVLPDLKADGYVHYLLVPFVWGGAWREMDGFTDVRESGVSFATHADAGFDAAAVALLRAVMPTFFMAKSLHSLGQRLDDVLRTYVGDEPHRQILSGMIQRGQVTRIRSALLVTDMRGYTRLSLTLSPEQAVDLLNGFFECLVPFIESEGGEVLKYLGDGLLAIFRDCGDDSGSAVHAALTAARYGLRSLGKANARNRFSSPVAAGAALHHGEAAYGNVGSGQRLDFTVIGPDVNLASRIARLNRPLGEPLLMSKAFNDHLWGETTHLGRFAIDGFDQKVDLFRPGG